MRERYLTPLSFVIGHLCAIVVCTGMVTMFNIINRELSANSMLFYAIQGRSAVWRLALHTHPSRIACWRIVDNIDLFLLQRPLPVTQYDARFQVKGVTDTVVEGDRSFYEAIPTLHWLPDGRLNIGGTLNPYRYIPPYIVYPSVKRASLFSVDSCRGKTWPCWEWGCCDRA